MVEIGGNHGKPGQHYNGYDLNDHSERDWNAQGTLRYVSEPYRFARFREQGRGFPPVYRVHRYNIARDLLSGQVLFQGGEADYHLVRGWNRACLDNNPERGLTTDFSIDFNMKTSNNYYVI
jgi:hypothetical protein